MRGLKTSGKNHSEEVAELRARVATLERINRRLIRSIDPDESLDEAWVEWERTFDATRDSIMILDHKFRIVQANLATSQFFGKPIEQIVGEPYCRVVHSTDEPYEKCFLKTALSTKNHEEVELYMPEKNIWIEVSVDPILDDRGNVKKAIHVIRDITERKKAEHLLQKERDKAQKYLDVAAVMLIAVDSEQRVGLINKKGCEILGYAEEEILGKNWFDNFLPERVRDEAKAIFEKFAKGQVDAPEYVENLILTKDGRERLIAWHNTTIKDEQGNFVATLSSGEDVTDRKRAEERASRTTAILDGINRVFREALRCETEDKLGCVCLTVAEELADSKFGFIGELNREGLFDTLAVSDPGWDACEMPGSKATRLTKNMPIRGVDRAILRDGKSRIVNDPASHPDHLEHPKGHPHVTSFLGVPLESGGETIGMIGLANKESGYEPADQEAVERLSVAFVEALMRKRAEQAVLESEQKYRELVEQSVMGIAIAQGIPPRLVFANPAMAEITGYSVDELTSLSPEDFVGLIHPEEQSTFLRCFKDRWAGKELSPNWLFRAVRKDQTVRWLEFSCKRITYQGRLAMQASFIDITARKKAEDRLLEYQAKLKAMTFESLQTEERERKRIALGLHDNICQNLVLTKMLLKSALRLVSDPSVSGPLKMASEAMGELIEQANSLIFELSNPILHELGFVLAMKKHLTEEVQKRHGIEVELEGDEGLHIPDEEIKSALFRISRELLMNIVKHAQARNVKVSTHKRRNQIQIVIQDDGVGFDSNKVSSEVFKTSRFGLFSIREQLEHLGGTFTIESEPGRGTTATVVVPLGENTLG